jgi:putative nucleotidyltransferase with HDIG domain
MASKDSEAQFIEVDRLRIGMFVYLDLGWMKHPFALNSFKISSRDQIDTILGLGLTRIRWSPDKSDPEESATTPTNPPAGAAKVGAGDTATVSSSPETPATTTSAETVATNSANVEIAAGANNADAPESANADEAARDTKAIVAEQAEQRRQRRAQVTLQNENLELCERQYASAGRSYRLIVDAIRAQPDDARGHAERVIGSMVGRLLEHDEVAIRLLSENAGEKASLHSINVTVIALLLGKAMNLDSEALADLGTGALLHDVGKIALPERLRWKDEQFSNAERHVYEEHVTHGAGFARGMKLSPTVQTIIAQHHEWADGRGYPRKLAGDAIAPLTRIVALVNHYDNLCNPGNPTQAVTPHEALSLIFAQMKKQFDTAVLTMFIRMMGVYPPGSVVELTDGRHALVVSVNSSRPLKPHIVIHDPRVPRTEALVEDLETLPELGIRRSLKPLQLPKAAFDYLSPRQRICYFFERARTADECEVES